MNIAKVKEKQSVSENTKEKIQAAPKELLRRGLLDGTEKLRGQLRDAAEGGRREEDVSDHVHRATARGTRLAADKLGNLVRSGRKNEIKDLKNLRKLLQPHPIPKILEKV